MSKPTYQELKQMKPEDRRALLDMLSLASIFGGNLFYDTQKMIASIEREEAEQRAAQILSAAQEKVKADTLEAAKEVGKSAAEIAAKSAARVLAADTTQKTIDAQNQMIEQMQNTIKEQQKTIQQVALNVQKFAESYVQVEQQNQHLLSLINNPSNTLLLAAADIGDIEKVKAAITLGANINAADKNLQTALHKACLKEDIDLVNFLLSKQCNISLKDIQGKLPSDLTSNDAIKKLLIEDKSPTYSPKLFAQSTDAPMLPAYDTPTLTLTH